MKVLLFIFLIFIGITACNSGHQLKSEEGNFSVNFPGKPTENIHRIPTKDGNELEIFVYAYESHDSTVEFFLSYNNIPNFVSADPDSILQGAKMGPAQVMRTSIMEEKKLEINGYPGLYFKGLGLDVAMIYYIYVVKDRMYQLAILNKEPREPTAAEIKNFMGSFKLLEKP